MTTSKFGKDSELFVQTKVQNGKTVLADSFFTAPLKIAKPLYDKSGFMKIIIMSASAGIMEGDCYRLRIELGLNSKLMLSSQSYTKVFHMKSGCATQFATFILGESSFFDFAQKPIILFKGSEFYSTADYFMKRGSKLLYSEIIAPGRKKMGELFEFRMYQSNSRVYYEDELIFVEKQSLSPALQNLKGIGFYEGYSHQAILLYVSDEFSNYLENKLYHILNDSRNIDFGISLLKKHGVIIRILGTSGDYLEKLIYQLKNEIALYNDSGVSVN